jgi:hypothetical protein
MHTAESIEVRISIDICVDMDEDEKITIMQNALKSGHRDIEQFLVLKYIFDPFAKRLLEDRYGNFYTILADCNNAYLADSDEGRRFVIGKHKVGDMREFGEVSLV